MTAVIAVYTSWNEGITKVQQIVLINGITVTAIRAICCSFIWNVVRGIFVHILSSLCPYIDSFTSCLANLPDLLKNTTLSTSLNESGSVFLRKSKRTKERIPIKYGKN